MKCSDPGGNGSWGTILWDYGNDGDIWWLRSADGDKRPQMALSDANSEGRDGVGVSGAGDTSLAWMIITARLKDRSSEMYENGVLTGGTTKPAYDPGPWLAGGISMAASIGDYGSAADSTGFHPVVGGIAELIVHGEALTDEEINATLSQLSDEYGIDVDLLPRRGTTISIR